VKFVERADIFVHHAASSVIAGLVAIAVLGMAQDARAQVPSVDIEHTCHMAARNDFDICLSSEQAAREQTSKDWANFSAADKQQCLQPRVYLPSYVEWQTCLQMERDVRTLRGNSPAPSATAPVTLPTVPPALNDAPPAPRATTTMTLPTIASGINDERARPGRVSPIQLPVVQPSVHD